MLPRAMTGLLCTGLVFTGLALAASPEYDRARELYQRTQYKQSIAALNKIPNKDADTLQLLGQAYYGAGEYKDSTETLEKAAKLAPRKADIYTWLGRAYGRRAETSFPLTAPSYAGKARDAFEKALALDPQNRDAMDDLFEYYLAAPGFLGGSFEKAQALSLRMGAIDAAWGLRAEARLLEEKKDYNGAEQRLKRAIEVAPRSASRFLDYAKYLAKQGRTRESDDQFAKAAQVAPDNPEVKFARAKVYIEQNRNLTDARMLLEQYLSSNLTPDNPPREEAQALLRKISR